MLNGGKIRVDYMTEHCRKFLEHFHMFAHYFVGDRREEILREALRLMVAFDCAALLITALPLFHSSGRASRRYFHCVVASS